MAKLTDKEVQKFLDDINKSPGGVKSTEPPFQRYRKHFLRDIDFNDIKKYSPEQLIRGARTSEELFILGEYLQKEWGRDHWWWKEYHQRRVSLSHLPSLYGVTKDTSTGKQRGMWGVPIDPEVYVRSSQAGAQKYSVNRRIFSRFASWEQVTGQRKLFSVIDTPNGPQLKGWKSIKPPTLPSNAPSNALIFDIETTGLLGKSNSNIISLGVLNTQNSSIEGVYADFNRDFKYPQAVRDKIIPQWEKATASGVELVSEKQLVEGFIEKIEKTSKSHALMGYNIKQFDLPKIYESAKKYGLHNRFESAVKQSTIIDVAEYAQSFISKQIGGSVIGWEASELGLKPLGWQLEVVSESLGYKSQGLAHEAKADVQMTKFIWDKLKDQSKWDQVAKDEFNADLLLASVTKQKGISPARIASGMGRVNFSPQMMREESKYLRSFGKHLEELYPEIKPKAAATSKVATATSKVAKGVTAGRVLSYGASFVGTNMLFPGNFWQNAISSAGWEAARIGAQKAGLKGWKPWAAAIAGSTVVNAFWFGAKALGKPVDVAVNSTSFSGRDDPYNFIQGLEDSGLKQTTRHQLTDFGSGYQGPNPWLNPEYNQAEEEYRYMMMRASKLGSSEQELYEYFTKDEEPSEYLAATASAGTALHLLEEAKAVGEGRVLAAEELAFDPQFQISGHIDLTYQSGAPADVKTLSNKRYQQVLRSGAFNKHVHQLNWYMNQKNSQTGYLEYINREDTSQRTVVQVDYDEQMFRADMEKLARVRNRIRHEIEAGILNEALLPKTASLETLKQAAAEEAGKALENSRRVNELEDVFNQEMTYLRSVQGRRNLKAASGFVNQRGQKFSGKGRNYNTIEGLRHDGLSQYIRKENTAFGSGFDAIRGLLQNRVVEEGKKKFLSDNQKRFEVDKKNKFSGRDDEYNTIEGLMHGGFAEDIRHLLTEFGSGWDPLRKVAKALYKGVDEEEAFKKLTQSEMLKNAISTSLKSQGEELGAGLAGAVKSYKAELQHGIEGLPTQFEFAVKQTTEGSLFEDFMSRQTSLMAPQRIDEFKEYFKGFEEEMFKSEVSALGKQAHDLPSLYGRGESFGLSEGTFIMEKFQGTSLKDLNRNLRSEELTDLYQSVQRMHDKGITHVDLHRENVFLTDEGKIGLIDLGMSGRAADPKRNLQVWERNKDAIQEAARNAFGREITPHEFMKSADKASVYSYHLRSQGRRDEAMKYALVFNDFLGISDPKLAKQKAEQLFDAEKAVDKLFETSFKSDIEHVAAMPKPLGSSSSYHAHEIRNGISPTARTQVNTLPFATTQPGMGYAEEVAREVAAEAQHGHQSLGSYLPGPSTGAASPKAMAVHKSAMPEPSTGAQTPNAIRERKPVPEPDFGRGAGNHRAKRMQRFRDTARKAVGLGHRAAHNAGRRHSRYSSVV